jgi:hypothetical protein
MHRCRWSCSIATTSRTAIGCRWITARARIRWSRTFWDSAIATSCSRRRRILCGLVENASLAPNRRFATRAFRQRSSASRPSLAEARARVRRCAAETFTAEPTYRRGGTWQRHACCRAGCDRVFAHANPRRRVSRQHWRYCARRVRGARDHGTSLGSEAVR